MGVALAAESAARGHDVTLLLGQAVAAAPCCGVHCERFDSTRDLAGMLDTHFPACDLLIMAAAVSDFIPEEAAEGKLDRRKGPCSLALSPAPDLVAQLAAVRRPDQRIVGFALEAAEDLEARAVAKMRRKNLDAIVGNPLATMEGVRVSGLLAQADGSVRTAPPDATKPAFAAWLLDRLHL
jgi:phosphopantothenoylcysteine decarboxylase/phosphopantothenate--cysteine ligase